MHVYLKKKKKPIVGKHTHTHTHTQHRLFVFCYFIQRNKEEVDALAIFRIDTKT